MRAQEVIVGSGGGCGHVTLNRPKAINALNFDMCRTIIAALQSWEFDPEIAAITRLRNRTRAILARPAKSFSCWLARDTETCDLTARKAFPASRTCR